MLIRWATEKDLPAWYALATEVSSIFQHPADMGTDPEFISYAASKINKYEALTAVDYMSGKWMGFIGFSRANNRISWFAVSKQYRGKGAGDRLLKTALRQLDTNKDVTVVTFCDDYPEGVAARALYRKHGFTIETPATHRGLPRCQMTRPAASDRRGGSFHYRYPEFIDASLEENCLVCNNESMPDDQTDIATNEIVWICGEYPGQGRLFGKMYVMPRKHYFHFEDMPEDEAAAFMNEVQRVGRVLRKVTGAEKINYEMHSNSGAHLHIHLFPRYLDDDFPSAPIDYRVSEPAPYESYEEYLWFIERMREELKFCMLPDMQEQCEVIDPEVQREIEYYNALPVEFENFIELPELSDGGIYLVCTSKSPAIPEKKWVPSYNFAICRNSEKIGEINLRIGYTDGLYYGGQIGYGIDEQYRGNGYAGRACRLLLPVAKAHKMVKLLITNNQTNTASMRVCEKLGARLVRVARLPQWHDLYKEGRRFSNIYEWDVDY